MTMIDAVRIDEHFECSQQDLWEAITDTDRLSAWLGGTCVIEPRVRGDVVLDIPTDGVVARGTVRSYEPPRPGHAVAMIEHTFVDAVAPDLTSVCRWAVISTDDGSQLLFTHDGLGEASTGWHPRGRADVPPPAVARVTAPESHAVALLREASTILLVSFIGSEVPTTLVEAGFDVIAKTGPHEDDWASCAVADGELVCTKIPPPTHADLVHLDWVPDGYIDLATELGARTVWYHSARTRPPEPADNRGCWVPAPESARLRSLVEVAGVAYIDDHYIADIARLLGR